MFLAHPWLRVVYVNFMSGDPPDSDASPYFSIPGETGSIYRENYSSLAVHGTKGFQDLRFLENQDSSICNQYTNDLQIEMEVLLR